MRGGPKASSGWRRLRMGLAPVALAVAVLPLAAGCADVPAGPAAGGPAAPTAAPTSAAPTTAAPTTAAPTTAALPRRIVRPADLPGPGWRAGRPAAHDAAAEWPWALRQCQLYDPARYAARGHRVEVRRQVFRRDGGRTLAVVAERFAPGWAARSLADLYGVLGACSRYETAEFLESHAVREEGFAGDDSLLVESARIAPQGTTREQYSAVVRRGDVVVTVVGVGLSPQEVVGLATTVAARL